MTDLELIRKFFLNFVAFLHSKVNNNVDKTCSKIKDKTAPKLKVKQASHVVKVR